MKNTAIGGQLDDFAKHYSKQQNFTFDALDMAKNTLKSIKNLVKEHLEYEEYNKYHRLVNNNMELITEEVFCKKGVSPDTEEDKKQTKSYEFLKIITYFVECMFIQQ